MIKIPTPYRVAIGISIFLHVVLLLALISNLSSSETYRTSNFNRSIKIIRAIAVSQTAIYNQTKQIKQEKKRAALEAYRQEQKRKLALKKQQIIAQKHLAALKARQLQLKREAEKKALEKKNILALKKQREAKQNQLVAKQQELQEKLLQQEVQKEKMQIVKTRAAQMQVILNQYKAQIIRAIQQQWIVPESANKNLSCILLIRLAPSGAVFGVETVRSSGDSVLDRSARVAVFKASPLPVPEDSATFSEFRELRLTVRPLQIQSF
ncbi:cell envelope integrity protein TolA [Coxiella endosymbiont of Ornithodoros amblus]|uniref:cell envelope integrity protein TolA n=1 Tax=Coxiella endosymbiont of Ornithodoros amblus TaxID=1656166 RepID=UPI00244DAD76|nr:cell envelope integrity protein TolA [Coxiella endosymbiont of Ornithodoros amblus]MBW5803005.1 cell envelope integrity protein TolA [Coxiella endosymbiont of Ornithodoros amblus]